MVVNVPITSHCVTNQPIKAQNNDHNYFSHGHVWMWELDCEESWAPKNWCFWTVVLEETPESPLDCKEIQLVHSKGDQPWVFIGRTDAEAETPVLWPPHAKSWLIGKDSDAGRDWGQEEKGTKEEEMVESHHRLDAHGFGWTLGVGDGQGGLACCGSWGHKEMDLTARLNWTGSWWWTGKPGVLQSMGSQRVRHNWATELNWTEAKVPRILYHLST